MLRTSIAIAVALLAVPASPAFAQAGGSAVPPPSTAGSYLRDVTSGCDGKTAAAGVNCATGIMGTTINAAETAGNAAIWRGYADYDAAGAKVLGRTGTAVGVIGDGARLYDAWGKGNLGTEAAQIGLERGIDAAVTAGIGAYMGPLAPLGEASYGAGKLVGTVANQFIRPCNNSRGESQTLNDCINDNVYLPAMDAWQNRQFEKATSQEAIDAARQRLRDRMAEFDRTSSQNAVAAAQAASAAQSAAIASDPAPQPDGSAINSLLMGALLQNGLQNASVARPPAPVVQSGGDSGASGVCTKLDPKTGCHYGHDEKAHPGGCKKC